MDHLISRDSLLKSLEATSMDSVVSRWVNSVIRTGSTQEAIELMNHLRSEAMRLDRHLADPRHEWNSVNKQ